MKRRLLFLLLLLISALVVSGCATMSPLRTQSPVRSSGVGMKQVAEKREPNYLIAIDRTECTVSRQSFDKVKVGSRVLCLWS
jgi:hypothetical protein